MQFHGRELKQSSERLLRVSVMSWFFDASEIRSFAKNPERCAVGSMYLIHDPDMISSLFYLSKSVAPALILPSRTQSWEVCFDSVVPNLLRQYMTSASHVGHINRQPLWGFESFQKAKDNLKAFQVQMRRWLDGCWYLCHSWTLAPFHWNTGWTDDAASQLSFPQPTIKKPSLEFNQDASVNSETSHNSLKVSWTFHVFAVIQSNNTGLFGTPSRPCGACSLPEMEGYGQAPQRHGKDPSVDLEWVITFVFSII